MVHVEDSGLEWKEDYFLFAAAELDLSF